MALLDLDDAVLDDVLPPEIPVPAIAEVQVAMARAAEIVSGQSGDELKKRLRTGTIVTTDDRVGRGGARQLRAGDAADDRRHARAVELVGRV